MLKFLVSLGLLLIVTTGCSKIYYESMEKVGIHKRDIMVDRVENVQESQEDAQKEFKSALEQFSSLVKIENSDLKSAYEKFNDQYEDAKEASEEVSKNIDKLEDVSLALFDEWAQEIEQYQNAKLKSQSKTKLKNTQAKYKAMMRSMRQSEKSMEPILATFYDNVLTLKHSLNAQAIGALEGEFKSLKSDVTLLIQQMNNSIKESDKFIQEMK